MDVVWFLLVATGQSEAVSSFLDRAGASAQSDADDAKRDAVVNELTELVVVCR